MKTATHTGEAVVGTEKIQAAFRGNQ